MLHPRPSVGVAASVTSATRDRSAVDARSGAGHDRIAADSGARTLSRADNYAAVRVETPPGLNRARVDFPRLSAVRPCLAPIHMGTLISSSGLVGAATTERSLRCVYEVALASAGSASNRQNRERLHLSASTPRVEAPSDRSAMPVRRLKSKQGILH